MFLALGLRDIIVSYYIFGCLKRRLLRIMLLVYLTIFLMKPRNQSTKINCLRIKSFPCTVRVLVPLPQYCMQLLFKKSIKGLNGQGHGIRIGLRWYGATGTG
jgi:hypothetical protein